MSSEPEQTEATEEAESDRSMDRELLAIQRALRLIKTMSPDARTYVVSRLKQS